MNQFHYFFCTEYPWRK